MPKSLKSYFLFAIVAGVFLAPSLFAADGINGHLVTAQWLQQNLHNPEVLILDASPTPAYAARHIPGAVSADLMTYGAREMPPAEMEKLYRSWGISPGKKLVFYDAGGTYLATRQFFALHYHGFPLANLFILDGGLAKWQELGLAVTGDATPAPPKGSFSITALNRDAKAELPEVLTATGDPVANAVVEGLGPDWHFGQVHMFDRSGHIPNAVLLPAADLFHADKTFKSAAEIQKMLDYLGVRSQQQVYTYCGGGVAASAPWFALKFIVHYSKTKMYVGSELEWLSDDRQLPYWTYDTPSLLRESGWLQFWAGPMIRRFRGAEVSIVDVRSPGAYAQGHVPFSLNIPAEVFKANLSTPGKLAEILGQAGVNASHEAVVISGAGLDRDSALAFAVLEKLGQQRISILTDSMEKWTQLGYTSSKDPTVVGVKKAPQDLSIPPTAYPTKLRAGTILDDGASTPGIYPKVFIASGKDLPGKPPEGTVVHVPYTDLLNGDGTPKAAKDIWNILSKAGVPRYAELICISDDPGEAAVNYFVLKLMGFPDAKMQVM